jgi:hypothetical protein
MAASVIPYLRFGTGLLTSNIVEAGGFVRSGPDVGRPTFSSISASVSSTIMHAAFMPRQELRWTSACCGRKAVAE